MTSTIKILSSMLQKKQAHEIKEYTREDIQVITRELGINISTLVNYLIDIALNQHNDKITWGNNDSPLQKIQIVLSKKKESIEKPRQERCSLQEFEALAQYLKVSKQELLEQLITSLLVTYEENIRLMETVESMKDNLYVMRFKNKELQRQLNNTTDNTANNHKQNIQAELVKQGITPARKSNVSLQVIYKLKQQGLSYEDIAARLGVSRATVWRRIKEGEAVTRNTRK